MGRLSKATARTGGGEYPHCPHGYGDARRWCDWANETKKRDDVEWIIGPHGGPMLVEIEAANAARNRQNRERREAERKRFNWRQQHPVTDTTGEQHG